MKLERMDGDMDLKKAADLHPDAVSDTEDLEAQIATELGSGEGDDEFVLSAWRIGGPSRLGHKDHLLFKGDARTYLPSIYERLMPYGTDAYRIRISKNGKFWRKFDIALETPPKVETPIQPLASPKSDMAEFLAAMQRSNQELIARLLERQQPVAAPVVDPMAMFDRALALMDRMRPTQQQDSGAIYMNALTQAVTLIKGIVPSEKETGIYDLVLEGFKAVAPALPGIIAAQGQQRPPHMPAQIPQQVNPQSPQPPQQTTDSNGIAPEVLAQLNSNPQVLGMLKQAVETLLNYARASADPKKSAEWVCQNWSPAFIEQILGRPDWFQIMCYINPQAKPFDVWFEKLIVEISALMNNEEDSEENDESDNGSSGASSTIFDGNP